jgi:ectoine hydroxylase-related dioxygenase (phytanoyl-CoA dioxygenase family)
MIVLQKSDIEEFKKEGVLIVRGVVKTAGIKLLQTACDDFCRAAENSQEDLYLGATYVQILKGCNPFDKNIDNFPTVKGLIRRVTYPYLASPIIDQLRRDPGILAVVQKILGNDVVQIVNQINFNHPGGQGQGWGWHQDYRFRRAGMTNFPHVYLQTLVAIDAVTPENGGVRLVPRSPDLGPLKLDIEQDTAEQQFNASLAITPLLNPGDMVIFGPYTIHGSTANRSTAPRRVFINGFADKNHCTYGMPAIQNGKIVSENIGYMEYERDSEKVSASVKYA